MKTPLIISVCVALLVGGCSGGQKSAPNHSFSTFGPPSFGNSEGVSTSGFNAFHAATGNFGSPTNTGKSGFNPMAMPQSWRSYSPTK